MEKRFLNIVLYSAEPLKDAKCYLEYLHKNSVARDDVYYVLENLRNNLNEKQEDIVLEIMDIVVGWCRNEKEIW
ncbi:MAG: hypothetical protein N4A45_11880 [Flavobacteriales bacterium]|jgi:hypothetical protein|nr:hypothetical protein [Flavobacteriales bacterium]